MCGRFRLSRRKQTIEEYFDSDSWDEEWSPRYNIAPTQLVPVVRQKPREAVRVVSLIRWGLIPSWARDPSVAAGTINARSETACTKPAFADSLRLRRCLIPADGFYEWKRVSGSRQPYCFEVGDGQIFAFAGLWDRWKDANGNWIRSCSILTTSPNAITSVVHDRMPVILDRDSYDIWLDPEITDVDSVTSLLKPYDARLMRCFPVRRRLNDVTNDDKECSAPSQPAEPQSLLFS